MEYELLRQVSSNQVQQDLIDKLQQYLQDVLDPNSCKTLPLQREQNLCQFMVRFLRQCQEVVDKAEDKAAIVNAVLLTLKGLRNLNYDHIENPVVVGKIMHFLMIALLKSPDSIAPLLEICQHLFEFLTKMDANGNLPDTKHNTPLAANSRTHIWNAYLLKQKNGSRGKDDFRLLMYALKFHSLVSGSELVFDKFSIVVRRDLQSCDNADVIDGIIDVAKEVLAFLVHKSSYTLGIGVDGICQFAILGSCFALNHNRTEQLNEIVNSIAALQDKNACAEILLSWHKSPKSKLKTEIPKVKGENNLFCRTELLNSLMQKSSKTKWSEVETMFLTSAREEFSHLMSNNIKDAKLSERRLRATVVASNICSVMKNQIGVLLNLKQYKNPNPLDRQVNDYKSFIKLCIGSIKSGYFIKKLHELSYMMIKFSQSLKDSNLSDAIRLYEMALDMLEDWVEHSDRSSSELWSLYHELCRMMCSDKSYDRALDKLEEHVIRDRKNVNEIAALYVKCRKDSNKWPGGKRRLSTRIKDKDDHYKTVLRAELHAMIKCKVPLVISDLKEVLNLLLPIETEPMEYGQLLVEKAITEWMGTEFDDALDTLEESITVLKESGGTSSNDCYLARAYIWKYIVKKFLLNGKYKMTRQEEATNYTKQINDFSENRDKEIVKFKESFMLVEDHALDGCLTMGYDLLRNYAGELSPEVSNDVAVLYGVAMLNGKYELARNVARLLKGDSAKLMEARALYGTASYETATDVLTTCADQKSTELVLLKTQLLLAMGKVEEGYSILEPMCEKCFDFSSRNLGHFADVLSDYQRLPLEVLEVRRTTADENKNPLYLMTLSVQCFEQSFHRSSGLEADFYGRFPDKPDLTNVTVATMTTQFAALNEYLQALVNGSRRYAEVGEARHAKSYLNDALALSLRFCLPKWTARVQVEEARLSLQEGRVTKCNEKLRRAHALLNYSRLDPEQGDALPMVITKKDDSDDPTIVLMREFGFDEEDLIKSKDLMTNTVVTEHEASSMAKIKSPPLLPALQEECGVCNGGCENMTEFVLSELSLDILITQADCCLRGGWSEGARTINVSVTRLLDEFLARFKSSLVTKEFVYRQKLIGSKAEPDQLVRNLEAIVNDLTFAKESDNVHCVSLLTEALYLLGREALNSDERLAKSAPTADTKSKPELTSEKRTLLEQLFDDDANENFQTQMQEQAKEMKASNEKPVKNGRRNRRKFTEAVSSDDSPVVEFRPVLEPEKNVMMTPECRVSKVNVVRKAGRGRPKRNAPLKLEENESPERFDMGNGVTAAPRRPRRLERDIMDSTSELNLKSRLKTEIESPADVEMLPSGDSPNSVASDDLNQLLDELTLTDTADAISKKTPAVKKVKETKTKKAATRKTTSAKSVAVRSETETPVVKKTARSRKTLEEVPVTVERKTRSTRARPAENLRTGHGDDNDRVRMDEFIIEFRAETLDLSGHDPSEFPEIETLRGPPQTGRAKRNVKSDTTTNSGIEDFPGSDDQQSGKSGRKSPRLSQENTGKYLENAFDIMKHHPPILYRRVCTALGWIEMKRNPWQSAYYLNEAACLGYRHEALLAIHKKRTNKRHLKVVNETETNDRKVENAIIHPKDVDDLKSMVNSLPSDWTIVMLSVLESSPKQMMATRLRPNEEAMVVHCPGFSAHGPKLIESFEDTIADSRMRHTVCEDRVRWWTAKRTFSKNVQTAVETLENKVFSCWKGILLGQYNNADTISTLRLQAHDLLTLDNNAFSESQRKLMQTVLHSAQALTDAQIREALLEIFPEQGREIHDKILGEIRSFQKSYPMTGQRGPLILILDKTLAELPVENMPLLSSQPVVRSLSVYSIYCQHIVNVVTGHDQLRMTGPDMRNISYILDPDKNLPQTREQFQSWFSELGWQGSVGVRPSRDEFERNLTNTDMMLYLGHGSGQRFFDGSRLQKLQCRAAVVLMGCSSGALKCDGAMEPRGIVINYLLARSPFVMGNLWDITDGDIDRFTKALLEYWLSAGPDTKLHSAMQHAREACRLRHLTGSAPIIYGLPL